MIRTFSSRRAFLILGSAIAGAMFAPGSVEAGTCGPVYPLPRVPVGFDLQGMTTGDVDGDGDREVIVLTQGAAPASQPQVLWFSSELAYALGAKNTIAGAALGSAPLLIGSRDMNADGRDDIVLVSQTEVRILESTGSGFVLAQVLALPANIFPTDLSLLHYNGDGLVDGVLAINLPSIQGAFLYLPSIASSSLQVGALVPFAPSVYASSLLSGDFDADGFEDLATVTGVVFQTYLGSASGLTADDVEGTVTGPLQSADLDGDGDLDALGITNPGSFSSGIAHLINDGTGDFTVVSTDTVPHGVQRLATGDANGDGVTDCVAFGQSFTGTSTINVATLVTGVPVGAWSVAPSLDLGTDTLLSPFAEAADIDGDSRSEFLIGYERVNPLEDLLYVLRVGAQTGSLAAPSSFANGTTPSDLIAADLNGDLKPEVVTATGGNSLRVMVGNGAGGLSAPLTVSVSPASARYVIAADLNGDGDRDLVTAGFSTGSTPGVRTFANNGSGSFVAGAGLSVVGTLNGLTQGDFNADGRVDIAVSHSAAGLVSVLLGDGVGGLLSPTTFAAGAGAESLTAHDIDLDGNVDLAIANRSTSKVTFLAGNGDGTFDAPVSYSVPALPQGIAAGDLNGNGIPEVVVASTGGIGILFDSFTATSSVQLEDSPIDAAIADVDGDGRMEALILNRGSGSVSVVRGIVGVNNQVEAGRSFRLGANADTLAVADLDLDTRPDVVASSPPNVVVSLNDLMFASSSNYGSGKPGSLGVPSLIASAPPVLGGIVGIQLANALPGASPLLFVGVAPTNLAFDGGFLLVSPLFTITLPPLPPSGDLTLLAPLPADPALCELSLYLQSMFVDPGAAGAAKTAQTPGLQLNLGN